MSQLDRDDVPQGFAAKAKKALIAFVIVDVLIIAAVLALYLGLFRPQQAELERARDLALRAGGAMETRLYAVEARTAIQTGDFAAAHAAARAAAEKLSALVSAVPTQDVAEARELADIAARLELARNAIDRDTEAARRDLELVDARLKALYVAPLLPAEK